MPWRTFVGALSVFLLFGVNGYLVWREEEDYFAKVGIAQEGQVLVTREDPLIGMNYTKQDREQNFKAFGFDEGMVKKALIHTRDLEEQYAPTVRLMQEKVGDPDALADSLCGETQLRPHYGGLRFLVKEDRGRRMALNLLKDRALEWQEWSKLSQINGVYAEAELVEDRQPDATMMAVAAILLGKEKDLLDHNAPWGRGLGGTWDWKRVKKENPGVEDLVIDYFSVMHLFVELAQAEDGICG